jgi:hypothetical protein
MEDSVNGKLACIPLAHAAAAKKKRGDIVRSPKPSRTAAGNKGEPGGVAKSRISITARCGRTAVNANGATDIPISVRSFFIPSSFFHQS